MVLPTNNPNCTPKYAMTNDLIQWIGLREHLKFTGNPHMIHMMIFLRKVHGFL